MDLNFSNLNCRDNPSIDSPQRSNYDINYVSVNTRGPYRHSVRALLLCNSQRSKNYSYSDHTIAVTKNSCKNLQSNMSTEKLVVSDLEGNSACVADNFAEHLSMDTRNILHGNSFDPCTSNTSPCYKAFMPNIKDSCGKIKQKYTNEEPTDNYDEMDKACSTECLGYRSQGAHNIFSNDSLLFSSIERECKNDIDCIERSNFSQVVDDKTFADKTTFCRPILKTYNQEFIFKTVERNRKLQTIIRKLIEVQEREKQKDAWNNYINKLKNKYRYKTFTRKSNPVIINRQKEIDVLKDCLNSRFQSTKSGPCRHLLQSMYAPQNDSQPCPYYPSSVHLEEYNSIPSFLRNDSHYIFENNPLSFLTSSQGRLLMLQQERFTGGFCNSDCYPLSQNTYNNSKKIFVPRKREKREDRHKIERNSCQKYQLEQRRNYYCDEYEENDRGSRLKRQKEQYLSEAEENLRKGAELEKKRKALLKKRGNKRLRKSNTEEPVEKKIELKGQDYDQDTEKVDSTEEEQRVNYNKTGSEDDTLKARYNRISDKVAELKQDMCEKCSTRPNSSTEIEKKLDILIDTVHSLIVQFKSNHKCILNQPNKNECGLTTCISHKLLGNIVTDEMKQASESITKGGNFFEASATSNIDNNQPYKRYGVMDQTNLVSESPNSNIQTKDFNDFAKNQTAPSHINSQTYSVNDQTNKILESSNSNIQTKDFNDFNQNQTAPSHINSKRYSLDDQTNTISESSKSNNQTKDINDFAKNQTVLSHINSQTYSVNDQTNKISGSSNSNIQTKDFNDFNKNQTAPSHINSKRYSVNDQTNTISESPKSNNRTKDFNDFAKNKTVPSHINSQTYSVNDQTNKISESSNSNIQTKDFNDFDTNQTVPSHINSQTYSVNDQTNKISESLNNIIQIKNLNDFDKNTRESSHRSSIKYSVDVQTNKTSLITENPESNNQINNFHDKRMKDFNKSQIRKDKSNIDERTDSKQTPLIEELTTSRRSRSSDIVDRKEERKSSCCKNREREKEEDEEKRQKEKHERDQREKRQKDSGEENDSTRMPPTFGSDPDVRMLTVGIQSRYSSRPYAGCFESLFRPEVEKLDNNYSYAKSDKAVCNMSTDSLINFSERYRRSKFDRILIEEIDKSNRARRDIQNMLDDKLSHPCKFQIIFDVPTKERSTEVTASLSKTKLSYHNKIENSNAIDNERKTLLNERSSLQSVTVAVNTDTLSILTLLQISKETIGRLISSVNFDYYSYLSMIQFPQLLRDLGSTSNQISQYVCNICGAVFMKASDLNNHIPGHGLGSTRDCCVCRHLLNIDHHPVGRFSCPYCGHCFTRAYCCELHQQSCARRLGTAHDIDENLSILR